MSAGSLKPLADLAAFAASGAPGPGGAATAQMFTFTCFGMRCAARVEHETKTSHLTVEADLGLMPYSIDCRLRRRMARMVLRASQALRHSRWRIGPAQRIRMEVKTSLVRPLTPESLLIEPLRALFEARPYIEILKDVTAAPAPRRGWGATRTRAINSCREPPA